MIFYRKKSKLTALIKNESGQAIVEMCVGIIGILVVFLGVIFIAGLGISNIKIYLGAKNNAEYSSRNGSGIGGAGYSIYSWDYGDYNIGDTTIQDLPFTANDQINSVPANNADTLFNAQITDNTLSESELDGSYIYLPINMLPPTVRNNFTHNLGLLFLMAADLVRSSSSYNESIYTLDSDIIGNNQEIEQLKLNFGNLINIQIDQLDLQQMESNHVYMPNLTP